MHGMPSLPAPLLVALHRGQLRTASCAFKVLQVVRFVSDKPTEVGYIRTISRGIGAYGCSESDTPSCPESQGRAASFPHCLKQLLGTAFSVELTHQIDFVK